MFMGFGGLTQTDFCTTFLFHNAVLDTNAKYAFGWLGACTLAASINAIAYFRGTHVVPKLSCRPRTRRALDTLLYGVQIAAAYFVMLLTMTYSGPMFAAIVIGFMIGHAVFTEYKEDAEGVCLTDGTCCNPPDDNSYSTSSIEKPILAV